MHMHLRLRLHFSRVRSLHVQLRPGPLHDVRLLTTVSLRFTSRKRAVLWRVKHRPVNRDPATKMSRVPTRRWAPRLEK